MLNKICFFHGSEWLPLILVLHVDLFYDKELYTLLFGVEKCNMPMYLIGFIGCITKSAFV